MKNSDGTWMKGVERENGDTGDEEGRVWKETKCRMAM